MKRLVALSLFLIPSLLMAQHLRSPQEVLLILNESDLSYEINILKQKIELNPPASRVEHGLHYFKDPESQNIQLGFYEYVGETEKNFVDGQTHFREDNPKEARASYKKVIKDIPDCSQVLTYIGQTYEMEEDYEEAAKWLEKAVKANKMDYMAHWFLADDYLRSKNKKKLKNKIISHIGKSIILNRNNPNIKTAIGRISDDLGLDYEEWHFTPQVGIEQDSTSGNVRIEAHSDWIGYAMSNAAYLYEPGYQKEMLEGVSGYDAMSAPFKEALVSLYVAIENEKVKDPQLKALKAAIKKGYLDEFIIFEILMPNDPVFAYQINPEARESILDYFIEVRMGAKLKKK